MPAIKKGLILAVLLVVVSALLVSADDDFKVSSIELNSKDWGTDMATFKVSYTGDEYKFVVATSVAEYTDGPYHPVRLFRKNYFLQPESSVDVELPVIVPASYGKAEISVILYDVVDTLDQLYESQIFYDKSFPVEYKVPPQLSKEVNLDIALPVLMEQNDLFDNALTRLVPVLLSRGKTVDEIAYLCNAKPSVIDAVVRELVARRFLVVAGEKIRPGFLVIDTTTINKLLPAIDKTTEEIYEQIVANMPAFDSLVRQLVASGKVTSDPNDVLSGSSILHHKYPLIMTFLMWNLLGRSFIADGAPFDIFKGSDPCNGVMGQYFYMVPAGDKYVGKSFYYQSTIFGQETAFCGFGHFNIVCESNYEEKAKNKLQARWFFERDSKEMAFMFNTPELIEPVSLLMENTNPPMSDLRADIDSTLDGYMYGLYGKGARYWCWNLVVTGVMEKLVKNNIVKKEGSGLYSFQRMD